ncbi:O-antigen ligase family protein [bacterium]|nr:O-antigen ligase family protein [bacterium]
MIVSQKFTHLIYLLVFLRKSFKMKNINKMGKKSREKKERRLQGGENEIFSGPRTSFLKYLTWILKKGVYFVLLTPLILSAKYYFPFVAPKSLYFMGVVEILFFLWIILAISVPKYRPNFKSLLFWSLVLFLAIATLSAVFGVNFSRSFWSKNERMTGLLMLYHCLAFFLVVSSLFKKKWEWRKVFLVSIFIASMVSVMAFFEHYKISGFEFSQRGGATLGNTSFLGTYLLFNLFLALYLFFREEKLHWRLFEIFAIGLGWFACYLSGARAATYSFGASFFVLFLFWLAFKPQKKWLKVLGRISLILFFVAFAAGVVLLCWHGSFVQNKFVKMAGSKARPAVWASAWQGFLERPWLGWGPENFDFPFLKHFNPKLFVPGYGGEVWFDRAHNIVFDNLCEVGILGFGAYLLIFIITFYLLWKNYFQAKRKEKESGERADFWLPAVFSSLLWAYFLQNLTVFDMVSSYMMLFLVLGFISSQTAKSSSSSAKIKTQNIFLAVGIFLVFIFTFTKFVWQPAQANRFVIKALSSRSSQQRLSFYKKALSTSPLGKFQIRELFAQTTENIIKNHPEEISKQDAIKELDFVANELEKDKEESFLNFKSMLRLAELYALYARIDPAKFPLFEKNAQESIALSPTNPQGYWVLSQAEIYQKQFKEALSLADKAISIEPRIFNSHRIAILIAKMSGDKKALEREINNALSVNPKWQKDITLLTKS